jgi:hypothetical protein
MMISRHNNLVAKNKKAIQQQLHIANNSTGEQLPKIAP